MAPFDLLFLASFLGTVIVIILSAYAALRRRWAMLRKLLIGWGIFAVAYGAALVGVSLSSPQHVLSVGEDRCWDDWCIAVTNVKRAPTSGGNSYAVTLRLSSAAKRVSQRENGVTVHLVDDQGRRYDSDSITIEPPFNILLGPGESTETVRVFQLPADARGLELFFSHNGPGKFIIGNDGSFFHKPTIIRIE